MSKYRLKKEAVPFFKRDISTNVLDYDQWTKHYNVDEKALEVVKPVHITYGFRDKHGSGSTCGWSNDDGVAFHFTLNFPSMKYHDYDKFSKGKMTRSLMDRIQSVVDDFQEKFTNQENKEDE